MKNISMTDENASAWELMGITKDYQIKRLIDWANMLEKRVEEFDPLYRVYPYGRTTLYYQESQTIDELKEIKQTYAKRMKELQK